MKFKGEVVNGLHVHGQFAQSLTGIDVNHIPVQLAPRRATGDRYSLFKESSFPLGIAEQTSTPPLRRIAVHRAVRMLRAISIRFCASNFPGDEHTPPHLIGRPIKCFAWGVDVQLIYDSVDTRQNSMQLRKVERETALHLPTAGADCPTPRDWTV